MTKPLALIVEDDPRLSDIFSVALRSIDFETEIAADGKVAISRLTEIVPTIVLLDLNLPGASGHEVLKSIRADERLSKTRVILTTADAAFADMIHDEADFVFLKPISPSQLRELASRLREAS
ncbi:MAG: response regulator [Chloroflexi bacterium]|nr:response regulator [Chloroflexota bacterium]MBI5054582.1 response regulator [Chloroflexota bacterium]MBI5080433.1 response regulator [Chloroflexota bacterium]MBI5348998.1 response regulator [Chloroflexota bacterium]MBI5712029.1 response regulator [Chloroflexota bacterium]